MNSCLESIKHIEEESLKSIKTLQNGVNSLFAKVNQIKDSVIHFYKLNPIRSIATVGRIALKPWLLSKEGISEIQPVIDKCTSQLQKSISAIFLLYVVLEQSTIRSSSVEPSAKPIDEYKPITSHRKDNEEEGFSEEEFIVDDYEETPKKVHNARVVSAYSFNRMKVRSDDFIITSKELHHRNHQIFINISRLQDLIRNEGKRVENDPFIQYVGKLDESHFVDSKQFDKVLKASENMLSLKRTNYSHTDSSPSKITKVMSSIKTEQDLIKGEVERSQSISVKMEDLDEPVKPKSTRFTKLTKAKQLKASEKRKRVSLDQEFLDEPELKDCEMKKLEEEEKDMEKGIEEIVDKPIEWHLHIISDTRYYNYQSLFPSPDQPKSAEDCSVVSVPSISTSLSNPNNVFVYFSVCHNF